MGKGWVLMIIEFGLSNEELELFKCSVGPETCEGGAEQETG